MNLLDIVKQDAEWIERSGISVDVNTGMGWVAIYETEDESIVFLQGDEGYIFIEQARAIYNNLQVIDLQSCYEHLARSYVECQP